MATSSILSLSLCRSFCFSTSLGTLDHSSKSAHGLVLPSVRSSISVNANRAAICCSARSLQRLSLVSAPRTPHVPKRLPSSCLLAKRKSSGEQVSNEEELDEDLRTGLNETANEAVKVMLAEDDKLLEQFKEKVDYLGEYLVQNDEQEAARFMLILRGMLDHEVYPQKDNLTGTYKKAFERIWNVVEDSGWLLTQPGAQAGEIEMVDDELIPPVLQTRY